MKNLIQHIIHTPNNATTGGCDCNYADNYYGDRVCVSSTADQGGQHKAVSR